MFMRRIVLLLIVFSLSFSLNSALSAQHNIRISMPAFSGDTLILGHYFRESLIIQDSAILNATGQGKFSGTKILPPGMYLVYLPNRSRFDLLIDKNQNFSIESDTTDLTRKTHITGDAENRIFYEYLRYLADQRDKVGELQKEFETSLTKQDSLKIADKIEVVNKDVFNYVSLLVESNPGTFLSKFLLALKEVEVPDPPKDNSGNIIDSTFQIRYFKSHYFDNFDLSDVRLLRTPFYEKKLMYYLDNLVIPVPDTVYKEVDYFIQLSRADTFLFKYILTTLFNYYANSKYLTMDAVYVYIAEKYYIPEAVWSDKKFIEDLKNRVIKIKPLLVGNPAPDIRLVSIPDQHFMVAAEDTTLKNNPYVGEFFNLRNISANFLLLYFWEADCGHCKKAIPELHAVYEKLKSQGVQVVAVHMLSGVPGKDKWVDFVAANNLYGWINAWNPYDFSYRDTYDVNSSNILYLFDKDKKILAKHISPEQAEQIILEEIRKNKNSK
jgi:thiol-disulfide isomerase/thioredoxin